jgi:hypothetical protein
MRENLLFYGIPESIHGINENCSELVKNLLESELKIDNAKSITFDRAHRLGPKSGGKVRPIVVKFHDYNSREMVRLKSLQTDIKQSLKNNGHGVGIQSPQEYRDARKAFKPLIDEAEQHNQTTRITGNKLFINKKLVKCFVDGKICEPPHKRD